ncbi:hypothetical protein SKAU_G00183160 [Synaphobranchus kaupii]|uniref:C2H2-type domain-containing protein n=1 Tax=Synaphobranchus kaupii TaxID=118154 RepID=A0A9Q1IUF5_SYNKA|nr:hypothetical protein SKAU_G00183160 [Synaphobranchus kaupii]
MSCKSEEEAECLIFGENIVIPVTIIFASDDDEEGDFPSVKKKGRDRRPNAQVMRRRSSLDREDPGDGGTGVAGATREDDNGGTGDVSRRKARCPPTPRYPSDHLRCTDKGVGSHKLCPASKPASTPASKPASTPASKPASKPASTPASKPASTPASKPASTPASTPASKPASTPASTPASKPASTPASTPASKPASTPASSPASKPASKPTSTPASTPASKPASTPASSPASKPASKPTSTPASTPASKPASTPASKPASKPSPVNPENRPLKSEPSGTKDGRGLGSPTHGGRDFVCEECSYSTNNSYNLACHARTHSGERPCRCSRCDRRFRTRSALNRHVQAATCLQPAGGARRPAPRPKGEPQVLECEEEGCDYSTLSAYNLRVHRRVHTDERPYPCARCDSAFRTQSHLYRHERCHRKQRE